MHIFLHQLWSCATSSTDLLCFTSHGRFSTLSLAIALTSSNQNERGQPFFIQLPGGHGWLRLPSKVVICREALFSTRSVWLYSNSWRCSSCSGEATAEDIVPIAAGDEQVESVNEFSYLGSVSSSSRRVQPDIDKRIAEASRAFGALRQPVFKNRNLRVETKRSVPACVLSILLYGAECWTPLRKDLKRLDSFHHRGIHSTFGITNQQQWDNHSTSQSIRQQWGDMETISAREAWEQLHATVGISPAGEADAAAG